jgi:hypothetical protein
MDVIVADISIVAEFIWLKVFCHKIYLPFNYLFLGVLTSEIEKKLLRVVPKIFCTLFKILSGYTKNNQLYCIDKELSCSL